MDCPILLGAIAGLIAVIFLQSYIAESSADHSAREARKGMIYRASQTIGLLLSNDEICRGTK